VGGIKPIGILKGTQAKHLRGGPHTPQKPIEKQNGQRKNE